MKLWWLFVLSSFDSLNLRFGYAQNFGPGFCALTCLDNFPCSQFFESTPYPGRNEYSVYTTTFIQGTAGLPECIFAGPQPNVTAINPIESIGQHGQVKYLFSPGYRDGIPYGDQLFVQYNVACPEHHNLYFSGVFDLEQPTCPGHCSDCSDYIDFEELYSQRIVLCGNGSFSNMISTNSLIVTFRSSFAVHSLGFASRIVCMPTGIHRPADCVIPGEDSNELLAFNVPEAFTDELVNVARAYQFACDPVLRTISLAFLESYNNNSRETDSEGSRTCPSGFYGSGHLCIDFNECQSEEHNCSRNAKCMNTPGQFICTCQDGYFGNGVTCLALEFNESSNFTCNASHPNCFCYDNNCGCLEGFELLQADNDTVVCNDINECFANPCGDDQVCKNTNGSYLCTCTIGYVYNQINGTCDDFDECRFNTSDCDVNAKCENLLGSFDCTCLNGYEGDGKHCFNEEPRCEDILECQQLCINLECVCLHGYILALDKKNCIDIDECALSYDNCDENASCTNTNGSFVCTCNSGYYGNGEVCIDINECEAGLHTCDVNADCINNSGSYLCLCRRPFVGDGFTCSRGPVIQPQLNFRPDLPNHKLHYPVGVNFCLEDSIEVIGVTVNCSLQTNINPVAEFNFIVTHNSQGVTLPLHGDVNVISESSQSVTVAINVSLLLSGVISVNCDVSNVNGNDSASTNVTLCDPMVCQDGVTNNCTQFCTRNSTGDQAMYHCYCETGLVYRDGDCVDRDECVETPSICSDFDVNARCVNLEPFYYCDCKKGYRRSVMVTSNFFECQDINECRLEGICEQICVNTNGSYFCDCYSGFKINQTSCINVNECETGVHNCSMEENMDCLDTYGSFICMCRPGYVLVNNSCEDIDECANESLNNCSYMCVNRNGSYECVCGFGYTLQDDNLTCAVSTSVLAGGVIGAFVFVVVIIILVCLCFKCLMSHWSQLSRCCVPRKKSVTINESEITDSLKVDHKLKGFSVQSSYKLSVPAHLIIHAETLELRETVGEGEFGIVYKGFIVRKRGQISRELVAIKTLKGFYNQMMVKEMLQECKRMCDLSHPNILSLTGVCLDGGPSPYIIMPFMLNGSLLSYLKKHRNSLIVPPDDIREVATILKRLNDMCIQVAKGMEYLAHEGLVHRDLAARNCMISINFVIKVADFGLAVNLGAKHYYRQEKDASLKLPLRWLAPESIHDFVFSEKSDVWAYGVTCWEIFSGGMLPYAGVNIADLPDEIQYGRLLTKPNNEACSDQVYAIMKDCWKIKSEERPTFTELVDRLSICLESTATYIKLLDHNAKDEPGDKVDEIEEQNNPIKPTAVSTVDETIM